MIQLNANVSPLIPHQFPGVYREQEPQFVQFVQAYYTWLEQTGNIGYYTRRIYDIKDVDNTDDSFLIYFKEKYLKNIIFNTEADIRLIIKHALDIYRSKGTERCATLLFELAYNTKPSFYYPSTDIFRLDDGQFVYPYYLELSSIDWSYTALLNQKEITGVFSGARAFVDNIVRRRTNGRFEDVAYISAVFGVFQPGEKVTPSDKSLALASCPSIAGSLNSVTLLPSGTGYLLDAIIPVSSDYGSNALVKVLAETSQVGTIELQFTDGGWGYQVNALQATLHLTSLTGSFANGSDVWTYYANGSVMGAGTVLQANTTVAVVDVLTGNLNNTVGKLWSYGNSSFANISSYANVTYGPTVYVSNDAMTISHMVMSNTELEDIDYFVWLETITEPMGNIGYISCNSALPTPFPVGANIYVYYANSVVAGIGTVLTSVPGASNTGTIVVSVLSGNLQTNQTFYTSANAVKANTGTYGNTTAIGLFMANDQTVTLNLTSVNGAFLDGEQIFQQVPLTGPPLEEKIGGWGTLDLEVAGTSTNVMTCDVVQGRFIPGPIIGLSSNATANVVSVNVNLGVTNTAGVFLASPYAYITSSRCSGYLTSVSATGTQFSVNILPTLLYPETVITAIDKISTYGNIAMNAATYGFPELPGGNGTTQMANCMTNMTTTIGKLATVLYSGSGTNFGAAPYIIIDNSYISDSSLNDDYLQFSGATGPFVAGEVVTQGTTNAKGIVRPKSNNLILTLERMSFANDFIITANATTKITGLNSGSVANVVAVDHDIFSPIMARNAMVDVIFTTGNNVVTSVGVVDSGFGFVNGETILIGSNGAVGTAIIGGSGTGSGFYLTKGGFLDDVKKLYDGWFYQNFSYQVISPLMLDTYQQLLTDITHIVGTKMFGQYVHTGVGGGNVGVQNAIVNSNATAILSQNSLTLSGLVLHYTFDGGTATDTGGGGYNGSLINSPTKINGQIGDALSFVAASNQSVTNAAFPWPNTQLPTSVSFWVNTAGGLGTVGFSVGNDATNRFQCHMPWSDNLLYWDYGGAGPGRASTSFVAYLNAWTHVCLVADGSSFQAIYLNGTVATSVGTAIHPAISLTGVTVGSGAGTTFQGSLDDFQIYNRVLSPTEISAIYHAGIGG